MTIDIFETRFCDETYRLRFDPAQASCPIEHDTTYEDEGGWEATGKQVADFGHSPKDAMRDELEEAVSVGGDDPDDCEDEIVEALDRMTRTTCPQDGRWHR